MSATCYYCGWWTDINGVCVCGYSGKPTVRNDSCMAWKPKNEIVTNADRIRAMSDEELADFINDTEYGFIDRPGMCDVCAQHRIQNCYQCWLDWLKQECEK